MGAGVRRGACCGWGLVGGFVGVRAGLHRGVLGVGPARTSSGVRAGDAYMDFAGVVTAGDEGLLDAAAGTEDVGVMKGL